MGEVWAGRDLRLHRDVAVKVLRDADPDQEEVSRFVREATVAAGLQHPARGCSIRASPSSSTPTCTTGGCSSSPNC
jgi:hypothetical protein